MSTLTDEIKARIDLVELIGQSVPLRRSGSSFKGLCPFHQEKTPSFHVFPDRHSFICFGCGKKGSAFDWLMEREHLEFGEALRTLASSAGVQIPSRREPEQEERLARLHEILARAQTYYAGALRGAAGTGARRYLAGRGISDESVDTFGLGYAPATGGLLRYLRDAGFADDETDASGLTSVGDGDRRFDFFRDRMLFPIRDAQGRTIAFGGRASGDAPPKYLNTRDTLLFHKHETLFALDLARKPVAKERRAVVVEGYFDAIMAHQHGYRNVVATLGTALTERHLAQLRRLTEEVVLALDSDAAGQAATWRALQLAEQSLQRGLRPVVGPNRRHVGYVPDQALRLKVLTLPAAKDPDDLIRADPAAWPRLVLAAQPVVEFALAQLPARHNLSSAQGKASAVAEVAELLASIGNPIEQAHHTQRVAELLDIDEESVRRAVRGRGRGGSSPARQVEPTGEGDRSQRPPPAEPSDALDEYLLALLLRARLLGAPGIVSPPPEPPEFALPEARALHGLVATVQPGTEPATWFTGVGDELRWLLERVVRRLPDVERLDSAGLAAELARARQEARYRALVGRQNDLQRLVRDADEAERRDWTREMSTLAHEIGELDGQLRGQVGGALNGAPA